MTMRLSKLIDVFDSIDEWSGKIAAFILVPQSAVLLYEVISRKFFNNPTAWAYDVSEQMMLLIVMLGVAYTLREDGHISIEVIGRRLTARGEAVRDLIFISLFLLCGIVIIWYAGSYFWDSFSIQEHSSSVWGPPVYIVKASLPLSGALLILAVPSKIRRDIIMLKWGSSEKQN